MSVRAKHRTRTAPGRRAAGFTLLEIMVAMVVLSLIVTTAFGALRVSEPSIMRQGKRRIVVELDKPTRSGETETLRSVAGVLQRQFNQTLPLVWTEDKEKTIAFRGNSEQIRFIAPAPLHHGSTGLFEFDLVAETDDSGGRLVLYFQLHDPDSNGFMPDLADRQRVLLVDDLRSAEFRYYGAPVADDPPRWHRFWSSEAEAFPQLVQARFESGSGPWPDLVFALPTELAQ